MNIPFFAFLPYRAPTNFWISGLPTVVLSQRLAWIYSRSSPSLSSLITPSTPPSPVFPMARPASAREPPYPIVVNSMTTSRSKKSGGQALTRVKRSNSSCFLSFRYPTAIASSGVTVETSGDSDSTVPSAPETGFRQRTSGRFGRTARDRSGWAWAARRKTSRSPR